MTNANTEPELEESSGVPDLVYVARSGSARVSVYADGSTVVNDRLLVLTPMCARLLVAVASRRGKVCTTRMALAALYGTSIRPRHDTLKVYWYKLHKYLREAEPDAPGVMKTVWGRGYVFGHAAPITPQLLLNYLPKHDDRWNQVRKQSVLLAIATGQVNVSHVLTYYPDLSLEELDEWQQQCDP